jgi:hypothetical protein
MAEGNQENQQNKVTEVGLPPEIRKAAVEILGVAEEWPHETTDAPAVKSERSDDVRRLMTALALAQGEIENAGKGRKNTHFNTTYADLADIANACRPALSRYLIAWVQIPKFTPEEIWLETTLTHGPSGQYVVGKWPIPGSAKNKSQDLVAAFTYARRASLATMVGVVSEDELEDDDGNSTQTHTDAGVAQPAKETVANSAMKQWVPWAIRKVGTLKTMEELTKWEEEKGKELRDLNRALPEEHAKVMQAIQDAGERLSIVETPPLHDQVDEH